MPLIISGLHLVQCLEAGSSELFCGLSILLLIRGLLLILKQQLYSDIVGL